VLVDQDLLQLLTALVLQELLQVLTVYHQLVEALEVEVISTQVLVDQVVVLKEEDQNLVGQVILLPLVLLKEMLVEMHLLLMIQVVVEVELLQLEEMVVRDQLLHLVVQEHQIQF
jgi:hypothetical protein